MTDHVLSTVEDWRSLLQAASPAQVSASGDEITLQLAKEFAPVLSSDFGVELTVAAVEAGAVEFEPALMAEFLVDPAGARAQARLDIVSAHIFADIACGGAGAVDEAASMAPLSQTEAKVATLAFDSLKSCLEASFGPAGASHAVRWAATTEPGRLRGPREIVFEARLGERSALLYVAAEPELLGMVVIPDRDPALDARAAAEWAHDMREAVSRMPIEFTARLEEVERPMEEIEALAPGSVLMLGPAATSMVVVSAEGREFLACRLGQARGRYNLRVSDMLHGVSNQQD